MVKKLPRVVAMLILTLLSLPSFVSFTHATVGYNPPLPSNTIFTDDFEGYSNSTLVGWGFFDNDAGCTRRVSSDRATSPIHALELVSSTASGGKCDTHRLFGLLPGQTTIRLQLFFAYSNTTRLAGHQMTFSVETWDNLKKYECVVFWTPGNSGTTGLLTFNSDGGNTNVFANLMAYDDSRSVYAKEAWHYVSITCDLVNHNWIDVIVDDVDYTSQLTFKSMVSISDGEAGSGCTGGTGLCWGHMYRIEAANVNSGTPAQRYYKYIDNVLVTDETPPPPKIILFGLVGYSAWIPLIMAMAGVNTTLSTWSLVIRLLKKNDGSALRGLLVAHTKMIVSMNIAVVAFLVVLVIGSIYLPGTCPAGSVCKG